MWEGRNGTLDLPGKPVGVETSGKWEDPGTRKGSGWTHSESSLRRTPTGRTSPCTSVGCPMQLVVNTVGVHWEWGFHRIKGRGT